MNDKFIEGLGRSSMMRRVRGHRLAAAAAER
jgi:hypothetical protein